MLAAFALATTANAADWWVNSAAPSGGDGSLSAPLQSIQQGIDAANHGDRVLVMPGTYFENIDFLVKSIRVESTAGAAVTLIRGDQSRSVVLIGGVQPVLHGFTVENGAGTSFGSGSYGGGILLYDAHAALVLECVVRGNYAVNGDGIAAYFATGSIAYTLIENNGGPAYPGWCQTVDSGGGVWGDAGLVLDHCTIRHNSATLSGGGVYGASLYDCTVTDNLSAEGAGVSHVYAYGTTIANNVSNSCDLGYTAAGGAENSTLEWCTISGNSAWDEAGGAKNSVLRHCTVRGNHLLGAEWLPSSGGGALNCVLEDCLVENNRIYNEPWSTPGFGGGASGGSALRTVFRGNSALMGAGVSGTQLERCVVYANLGDGVLLGQGVSNSIVRNNGGAQLVGAGAVRYSNIEGGYAGVGNIDLDPLFWNAGAGDFHLQPLSPCIDAGDPAQFDPDGSRVDMGAFPHDPLLCLQPVVYCSAGTSSNGCVPLISAVGTLRLSQSSGFTLGASGLPGQRFASVIYGVHGATQTPWGATSFSCVRPPRQRTTVQNTGSALGACDGSLALDFNAWRTANPFALGAPFGPGDTFWAQVWYRDAASSVGTNFTDAVRFMSCP
jgi:hypothetical protein